MESFLTGCMSVAFKWNFMSLKGILFGFFSQYFFFKFEEILTTIRQSEGLSMRKKTASLQFSDIDMLDIYLCLEYNFLLFILDIICAVLSSMKLLHNSFSVSSNKTELKYFSLKYLPTRTAQTSLEDWAGFKFRNIQCVVLDWWWCSSHHQFQPSFCRIPPETQNISC